MATRSTNSELSIVTGSDSLRARHLLAVLESLGRPAGPLELASLCTSFPASPELVLRLCSIPDSPLVLTDDLYVKPSPAAENDDSSINSNFVGSNIDPVRMLSKKRKGLVLDCDLFPSAKRRLNFSSGLVPVIGENRVPIVIQYTSPKVPYHVTNYINRSINILPHDMSKMVKDLIFAAPLSGNTSAGQLSCTTKREICTYMRRKINKKIMACESNLESAVQICELDNLVACKDDKICGVDFASRTKYTSTFCLEDMSTLEARNVNGSSTALDFLITEKERSMACQEEDQSMAFGRTIVETENILPPTNAVLLDTLQGNIILDKMNSKDMMTSFDKEQTERHIEAEAFSSGAQNSAAQKPLPKGSGGMKAVHADAISANPKLVLKVIGTSKEKHQSKREQALVGTMQKVRQNNGGDLHMKERKRNSIAISLKDQAEKKVLPNFESYIVEEEEGSGGYGTVYRARKKKDGTMVAIKFPHANAHKHLVHNEQRMLERFGGKDFVIKYGGTFKHEDSDCFVLEHVEHDRPEVLKKEIDVLQLQWYGYCMFRALASLHKQGIVHRDVKPGNFLFSRKANKGYLIDFNLAMDLHQKYGNTSKSKVELEASNGPLKLPNAKPVAQIKDRKLPSSKSLEKTNPKTNKCYKSNLDLNNLRRKTLAQTKTCNNDSGSRNVSKSQGQGADVSGITSAKDATSTRTASAERMREPLPSQGRKELLSLVQEARQSSNQEASSVLSPLRKRIVAPRNTDSLLVHLTPMPLYSTGACVGGASLTKTRGCGKLKKEGACVGTKGFRAPEVLFRSQYQGPKVDIWSAGVTLLYLMIGRTPFFGDPEQNIKDIAKLSGSEALWEVAKLHNRESSFPEVLYSSESLPSLKLWDWCEMNTKKPNFSKEMPRSLFDLVDKCLTVNPRLRITAEEALKHEFFAPCHAALRKQRMLRQDSRNSSSLRDQSNLKPMKISN
ncbi:hypothetical protein UlMin_001531 [Ulmus minor]